MWWLELFAYSIVAYGCCNIVVFGAGPFGIIEKFREWFIEKFPKIGDMFACMMCFPANLGIVLSLFDYFLIPGNYTPFSILFGISNAVGGPWYFCLIAMIFDCFFTSGIVWLIHNWEEKMERTDE